ncbi:MAG: biphenyl 2,3-dioxygenase [Candidatus Tectomicrobia bacterium]|nr:biphenyl 2,3-dioxygenase [Candidatus Tectomicrobia bacterium]
MERRAIRRVLFLLGLGILFSGGWAPASRAAGDLSAQNPIVVEVRLGSRQGHLAFEPKELTFETGRLYKLVLINPSPVKHYFSALRFAAAVWTRKVQDAGMEVKGAIREIELLPGKRAEWFFVPVQAGVFELRCTIPGHAEAGMIGRVALR